MASIKGVTLKSVKKFEGHEGETLYEGNIYLENKKLGSFEDGDWGGPINVEFDTPEKKDLFEARMKEYYNENPSNYENTEFFIDEILQLVKLEAIFKKNSKKGIPIVVRFQYRERKLEGEARYAPFKLDKIFGCHTEQALTNLIKTEAPVITTVVRKLEDLVI